MSAAFARLWRALEPAFPCIYVECAMKTAGVPTLALLPNEVEIDAVRADLLEAVQEPMRPDHACLWLRGT